jgi:hypothetical protein
MRKLLRLTERGWISGNDLIPVGLVMKADDEDSSIIEVGFKRLVTSVAIREIVVWAVDIDEDAIAVVSKIRPGLILREKFLSGDR